MADTNTPTTHTTNTPLTLDAIASLLGDDSLRPKPKQVGPLKYGPDYLGRCTVCGGIAGVTVSDVKYCSSHALYALNKLCVSLSFISDCDCNAGQSSMCSLHTADCAIYDQLPDN